jgi:hypothetical protein
VVEDGLLFWILADEFRGILGVGGEGNGFFLNSDIWSGSLGMCEACVGTSDLGGEGTISQSSESVGDGDGAEYSTARSWTRSHSLI